MLTSLASPFTPHLLSFLFHSCVRSIIFVSRRTAQGLHRGAGHIRNSFRRARGLPPSAPAPEEPGPPTRPYGSRGGARRYPGRPGHHPGGSAGHPPGGPGHPHGGPPGPGQPPQPGYQSRPGHPQSPGQPQPVPSVSAHTSDGPGHSDIHPAYLPVSTYDCSKIIYGYLKI